MQNKSRWIAGFFIFLLSGSAAFAESDTQTVNLSFSIEPATAVKTQSVSGASNVRLGPIVSGVDAPVETLEVQIVTNSPERYRVYHTVKSDMMSGSGDIFPPAELLYRVSNGAQGGASEVPGMSPVPAGRTAIFNSAAGGGSDRFTIAYSVANARSYGAGSYYGNVSIDAETF
ncbi:MAG: hypothetical protein WC352_00310 [Candidatus Omnitrophota bacterium]|jgi:hypothetical protein